MPVFLEPAMTFLTDMVILQDGQNTFQNSILINVHPEWDELYFLRFDSQFLLNWVKGIESSGWRTWEVWGGMVKTFILLALMASQKGRLYKCSFWPSMIRRCFLSAKSIFLRYLTKWKPYSWKHDFVIYHFGVAAIFISPGAFNFYISWTHAPYELPWEAQHSLLHLWRTK